LFFPFSGKMFSNFGGSKLTAANISKLKN